MKSETSEKKGRCFDIGTLKKKIKTNPNIKKQFFYLGKFL